METQSPVLSDLLLAEVLPVWSRQRVALAAAATAEAPVGTVVTSAGAAVSASGTANAAAVLIERIETGDTEALAVARGAVVDRDLLIWPAAATDAQIATGIAALAAAGVVPRAVL
ncbi:MAG: head decoration protein [Azoarcus sp.]|jgi:hypothetical protein|nr:head decoration protein [Azoarcus sp.]